MILVGTSGFSYKDWTGPFYPSGTGDRDMLAHYARHFRVVELNFSYYRMPNARTLGAMADKTPEGFEFLVKAHRTMTHELPPQTDARDQCFTEFREALRPLETSGKLGCVLFQFPWGHRPNPTSFSYLEELRTRYPDLPLVVEFRNIEWDRPPTYDALRRLELGYCCVDEPSLRGLMPRQDITTSEVGYVRFHGRNAAKWWKHQAAWERYDYLYSSEELVEWVPRVRDMDERTKKTYVLYNNCHAGQAAVNARMMLDLLGLAQPPLDAAAAVRVGGEDDGLA